MKNSTWKISLLLFPILFSANAFAQEETRSFFSVSGGYSLPVGEMANEKADDSIAGLAGPGYYGQVNYDFRMFKWFGIRASGSMNKNTTNSGPMIDKAHEYTDFLDEKFTWNADVSRWKLSALMVGPALYININKMQIEFHGQVGQVWATSPTVNVVGNSDMNKPPVYVNLKAFSRSAFGFESGASFRFPIVRNLYLQVSGDIIGAKIEVKDLKINATRGTHDFSEKLSEKRFVGVVNVGGGIGIAF